MSVRQKSARVEREKVHRRISQWILRWSPHMSRAQMCERLQMRPNQLRTLLADGAERCNLEYLLEVWERCGGSYSVILAHAGDERTESADAAVQSTEGGRAG